MFIEGKCTAKALIPIIISALTTVNPDDGQPYWKNVSSNIGSSKSDDGYVFHSKGSSGTNDIYIGFKPPSVYWRNSDKLDYGYIYFTGNKYVPNPVQGLNGTFEEYHDECMPIIKTESQPVLGFTDDTIPMRYLINVNKDRVIIGYWCELKSPLSYQNVIYIGQPPIVADPTRPFTVNITHLTASTRYGHYYGAQSGRGRATNQRYSPSYGNDGNANGAPLINVNNMFNKDRLSRGWGNTFFPSHINLWGWYYRSFIGTLDLYIAKQDGSYRNGDSIIINQVEYGIIEALQATEASSDYGLHCGFTSNWKNGQKVLYLIPKN